MIEVLWRIIKKISLYNNYQIRYNCPVAEAIFFAVHTRDEDYD